MGANLAPEAWEKIVQSSIQASTNGADYPDRLHQIWETGDILHQMRDIYAAAPAAMIKDVLAEMGIIESPWATSFLKDSAASRQKLMELMARIGAL